jgi:diguanylate cyclase (GGDEF)-like protein
VPQAAPRPSASLQRHFLRVLLGVAGIFAAGIGLSVWFSLQSTRETQQYLIQVEAEQARSGVLRQLDYYRNVVDNTARDPELAALLRGGSVEAQQAWAQSRQRLLPDLLGMALVDPRGEVLGDPAALRVGPACQEALQRTNALTGGRLLLHLDQPGLEHVELLAAVRDIGGRMLGGVFVSVRLAQLHRVIEQTIQPRHVVAIVDAAGHTSARHGKVEGPLWEVLLPVGDTGWTLVAQAPVQWLTLSGGRQVLAGLLTSVAVLLVLAAGMFWLRGTMLHDIVATRDALDALARDEAAPEIVPHYVEFEPVVADINLIALHLQEQRARLAHLSLTDPLTGLPNRRAFETHFPQALGRAEREHPVALVMLDIDHFKGINDRHGHGVGDQVLLALAESLKALTRRADLSARLAGDEFAVLLSDVDAHAVEAWYLRLADHFRSELNAFGLDFATGISAGQTWLGTPGGDTLNAALARADRALYQAKARGRGQLALGEAPAAGGTE